MPETHLQLYSPSPLNIFLFSRSRVDSVFKTQRSRAGRANQLFTAVIQAFGKIVSSTFILFLFMIAPASSDAQSSPQCPDPTSPNCNTSESNREGSLLLNGAPNGQNSTPGQQLQVEQQPGGGQQPRGDRQVDRGTQVYVDSAGAATSRKNMAFYSQKFFPPDPISDIQRLAQVSSGEFLPIFGRDLFQQAPSTFAPSDQTPALSNYTVGPGDELLLRLWGPESFNGQLTVDSSGSIYVPQVGAIHVAGLRMDELQSHISDNIKHTFRSFDLSVNLGQLRSIQVYVVGEARRPGAYTVSSLSTVLNVLFIAGGPNVQGSLRRIQVRREGATVGTLDLYDLLLRGDKTQDIRLQPNDTIFIPAVGAQVAFAGSVHHPAVYELRDVTTVASLLDLAGGFTSTASTTAISLERVDSVLGRSALNVNLDADGRATAVHDGDVLFANHISNAYLKSVTIRGNLANPGRFSWHPGMRLSEIIPDRMSLLTNNYWKERNRLGVPVPLFEPLEPLRPRLEPYPTPKDKQVAPQNRPSTSTTGGDYRYNPQAVQAEPASTLSNVTIAEEQQGAQHLNLATKGEETYISIPAPEIDWSYAVIERLDPSDLKNSLVPFSLQRLLIDHDPTQDLELQAGDIVTILSQNDIHVPQDEQTKYVRLEGEFTAAGVYSVGPNETLSDVVRRAGGLTKKAYLYGASFTRESARISQQHRLDEYISTLAVSMQRATAERASSSVVAAVDTNAFLEQRDVIAQLRKLRATGRIVLEFSPESSGEGSIPPVPLEDGDVFLVSSRPLTVNVIGAVYAQNVFLYNRGRRVEDYLRLAGNPNSIADRKHAFIIRADGSVYSRERAQGVWKNSFEVTQISPGDAIIIPERPVRPSLVKQFIDYSQIASQFALSAAALSVIKQ